MKRNRERFFGFSIIGFLLFFLTIGLTSTCSIFVYYLVGKSTNNNVWIVGISVLVTIIIGAVICAGLDIIRRKHMIEKPVKMILNATQKIASGDFSVKLTPLHEYSKYTEYDLIFENINIMTKELSKNEMLKNDFVSNVSHEIKTPLSIIQNYAKILQDKELTKNKKQEYLNGLITQTKKLADLISNILKLNKLENQQTVPEVEQFDLAELLRVTTLNYENLLEKKHLELECDIDEVSIVSSASLLEIVLNNLISNAIKFTDAGGKIAISLKQTKTHAIINITDTGCGISQEVGEHIFDKFYQGDTSRSTEGNGLGLALVKKVIDLIGGEISVKSKVGVGSTFTLKLNKG
ncbi:MAG: GHKL domain-containing protein [Clostridia bacterium]|nr:GHKL domain-containing protein [Clostridia bacterium]